MTGSPVHNVPVALRVRGELDQRALEESLRELAERHALVAAGRELELRRHDLGGQPGVEVALAAGLSREASQPFDAEREPLARASLWRLGEHDQVLLIVASAGPPAGVLAAELCARYEARRSGTASPPGQAAARERPGAAELERQLGYWRARLAGAPTLELPTDHPRPPVQRFAAATEFAYVPCEVTDRIATTAQRAGCAVSHVLTAAVAALLSRYSGQRDVVLGTVTASGDLRAIRLDLAGGTTFAQLLEQVRARSLEALANQDVPFERLVEELRPERDLSRNPLFQVLVAYEEAPGAVPALDGLAVERVPVDSGMSPYDLAFDVEERPDGWRVTVRYSTDLFEAGRMRRALGHLGRVLEAAVS
ncbi:MAG: hypothetical protein E6J41_13875, partial [Chloroflexi bacterium]